MKNQTQIFRRNKLKDLIILFILLIFVACGYSILEKNRLMGWLGISFFGLGAICFFIQLLTNVSYLKFDKEGFEEKNLFQTKKYKWSEVKNFRQANFRGNKSIFFDYNPDNNKWKNRSKLTEIIFGKQKAITSSHNIKTEELLNLMKTYKRKNK
ncbi:hypothetical protein H3Z83_12750 [Tenacibaculum sp. S7007]|uniref:Lipoprotein n=1 Tax=Tenacibaculum pelagium TaxID=2759527 RepID=A0A839ASV5_9FLAO|nr:STM3941 family protein [Tenacibaculum pelagium]MBA6157379.1 hypothetical protein [Tenacibaculum pelagium]